MTDLLNQKVLSHEEMVVLTLDEVRDFLGNLKEGWDFIETKKITKTFNFDDFMKAMEFVNKLAEIAEKEGHHPDIAIHYNKVEITLWSHFIGGLSLNDFIIAAKIDSIC